MRINQRLPFTRTVVTTLLAGSLAACGGSSTPAKSGDAAVSDPSDGRKEASTAKVAGHAPKDDARPGSKAPAAAEAKAAPDGASKTAPSKTAGRSAGEIDFPSIPLIVVPEIIGVSAAQRSLETSMKGVIDPIAGISVKPARCGSDGSLMADAGITSVDASGALSRVGKEGIFDLQADGSGEAVVEGATITVNADGSGSIVSGASDDDDDGSIVEVSADGSGSYNGPYGIIELDGKGGGSWNGDQGLIDVEADGSGSWTGPLGTLEINADGSGSWVGGPLGIVENNGDGTGTVGTSDKSVEMARIPKVQRAGKFPLLNKFTLPGVPCGYVITLSDSILFDFDKSDLRPAATAVLDSLAKALKGVSAASMEVRGHTDSKGSDAYNQGLSERRATAVLQALRSRGAAGSAKAKGYGESQPTVPNELDGRDNPTGRQANRRVEIYVKA